MLSKKMILIIAAAALVALVAGVFVWIFVLPGPSFVTARSESDFRKACAAAGGDVAIKKHGMGSDTLVCLSKERFPDAGAPCGRNSDCKGICYPMGESETFAGDISIGGAKGTCSEHDLFGTWP